MQELAQAIEAMRVVGGIEPDADEEFAREFPDQPEAAQLQRVAGEWAKMSTLTFSGTLLDRALDVSKAIAAFTQELSTSGSTMAPDSHC